MAIGTTSKTDNSTHGRVNTLGIQQRDLEMLLEELDRTQSDDCNLRREFIRRPFRRATMRMHILPQGGPKLEIKVACRNLSAGGASILHSAYLHSGTKVIVFLPHPTMGEIEVRGQIKRGCHISGMIHELGVKFDKPIKVREFVQMHALDNCFSLEAVKPEQLKGTLLYVEDSVLEQRIVKHLLTQTQLKLKIAENFDDGIRMAAEGCDLILSDLHLNDRSGVDLAARLRAEGIETPIILATGDVTAEAREALAKRTIDSLISKPLQQQVLLRALAEFMTAGVAPSAMASTLPKDHPNYHLVPAFVETLRDFSKQLTEAAAKKDPTACRNIAVRIRGVAPSLGFEYLSRLAGETTKALDADIMSDAVLQRVSALAGACRHAR
ncbi:MAG: response regulator [Planctomycetes bacterium]|nr:response regulator [Planctomycetota bacterium]